jgi:HemY protein
MRWLIGALLALLLAVAGGTLLARYSGRVIITLGDWTVQTTVLVFALALVAAVALLWFLFQLLLGAIRMPGVLRRWFSGRHDARFDHGLFALLRGDWPSAESNFSAAAHGEDALLALLLAARAAERQGAADHLRNYLSRARALPSQSRSDLELFDAELCLAEGRFGDAVALLERLHADRPRDMTVALLHAEACLRAELWQEALKALEWPSARPGERATRIRALAQRAHLGMLRRAGAQKDRQALGNAFRAAPAELRREPEFLLAYVNERIRIGGAGDCEPLLREALQRDWDARLVELYGLLRDDAATRLKHAERWLATHASDGALLLALGRICRDAAAPAGKARDYLERALELNPGPETCRELGVLLEQEGDSARAAACYKRGLLLASSRG